MKRFKVRALDRLATLFMWLALHCECWRVGHNWNLSPNSAWCEHCEDRIEGEKARTMYEAKYGRYVEPAPPKPWPPIVVDYRCPPDMVYMLDLSQFRKFPDEDDEFVVKPLVTLK